MYTPLDGELVVFCLSSRDTHLLARPSGWIMEYLASSNAPSASLTERLTDAQDALEGALGALEHCKLIEQTG